MSNLEIVNEGKEISQLNLDLVYQGCGFSCVITPRSNAAGIILMLMNRDLPHLERPWVVGDIEWAEALRENLTEAIEQLKRHDEGTQENG